MKKILLMIVIAALLAGCDYDRHGRHPEVLTAMRDPLFDQWLKRNKLVLVSTYPCFGCTRLHICFVDEKDEVK